MIKARSAGLNPALGGCAIKARSADLLLAADPPCVRPTRPLHYLFGMADIILINPRFELSYWSFEHALPFADKRAAMPVAGLPLLAALPPQRTTSPW